MYSNKDSDDSLDDFDDDDDDDGIEDEDSGSSLSGNLIIAMVKFCSRQKVVDVLLFHTFCMFCF